MTSMNDEAKILKADTKGRVGVPAERRKELLDKFERSGISAMRCANWLTKRRKRRRSKA
jgi:DNA-binding transcriptional regulator/RsmH inhibitor MraZ